MICGSWGTVDELVGAVLRLDPGERAGFLYKVEVAEAEESFLRARASLPAPERCPRCGSPRIARRGRDARRRQRWSCRGCGRSFTVETDGIFSRSPLSAATWVAFCRMFAARATLRECAEVCGVSLKTAWYMRVRVCGCIRREGAARRVAGEVVQGDEAFIPESASGNHSRNPSYEPRRPPRRRGGASGRECLLTLVGAGGTSDLRLVRGDRRGEAMRQLGSAGPLSARIECEMQSSVGSAAAALGMEVARSYSGERRLNPLNAVHGAMKGFLARFRGLSSRRAQLYLDWFSWHSGFRGPGAARERLSALIALVAVGRWGGSRSRLFGEPYPVDEREAAKAEAAACSRGRGGARKSTRTG